MDNMDNLNRPYFAKNKLVKKTQTSNEIGYLDVNVYTALGALPVKNANVSVYTWSEEEGEKLVTKVVTDESGKAPRIELPVLLNQGLTSEKGRTEYHLAIESPEFHTVIIINVEIYPNIANQFNVNLTPIPRGEDGHEETITIPIQTKNARR